MWFAYDYADTKRKKCIEFNGDFWHCNPNDFKPDQIHRVKRKKAIDIWKTDEDKKSLIENRGYQVLIIWESEYKKNPQQTLEKCIKFINE
jgi:G:T-mismatch repair DNA endonuclease (very short patch repair protein)